MSRVPPGGGYTLPRPRQARRPAPPPPGYTQGGRPPAGGGAYTLPPPSPGRVGPGGGYTLPPSHAKHAKHATHAKKAKKAKRGLARSAGEVACCAAEALAASLRLAGGAVADEDVLALYWHTAHDADAGASIWETLEAAAEHGLAGVRLTSYDLAETYVSGRSLILGVDLPGPHTVCDDGTAWWSWGEPLDPFPGAVIAEAWEVRWAA